MKNFNPFTGLSQVLFFSLGMVLFLVLFVGQIIQCGHFEWWQVLLAFIGCLLAMCLRLSWKEYKEGK